MKIQTRNTLWRVVGVIFTTLGLSQMLSAEEESVTAIRVCASIIIAMGLILVFGKYPAKSTNEQ